MRTCLEVIGLIGCTDRVLDKMTILKGLLCEP
jgi:hypothetical protein